MKCIYKWWVSVTFSVVSDLGFDMLAVSKPADNLEDSLRAWLPSCLTYQEDAWGRYKYQELKTQRKAYSKKETLLVLLPLTFPESFPIYTFAELLHSVGFWYSYIVLGVTVRFFFKIYIILAQNTTAIDLKGNNHIIYS